MSSDQTVPAAQAKLEHLARLRADGGVLRDYRAPRWDEPFIMEQGMQGERGILVPLAEDDVKAAVGEDQGAECCLWMLIDLAQQKRRRADPSRVVKP